MNRLLLLLLLVLLINCSEREPDSRDLAEQLPAETELVIRLKNLNAFKTARSGNEELNAWLPSGTASRAAMGLLEQLHSENTFHIALTGDDFLILTSGAGDSLLSKGKDFTEESRSYDGRTIREVRLDSLHFFSHSDSLTTRYSSSLALLQQSFEARVPDPNWRKLLQAMNNERLLSLARLPGKHAEVNPPPSPWPSGQQVIDLEAGPEFLKAFAASPAADSLNTPLPPNTSPSELLTPRYAPEQTQSLIALAPAIHAGDSLLHDLREIGYIKEDGAQHLLLFARDTSSLSRALRDQSQVTDHFQDLDIRELKQDSLLVEIKNLVGATGSFQYYSFFDEGVLVSTQQQSLRDLLANMDLERTFNRSSAFRTVSGSLADESHYLSLDHTNATGSIRALQLSREQGTLHAAYFNGLVKANSGIGGVRKIMELRMNAPTTGSPQFVRNHYTGKLEIVAQDKNGDLYRFGTSGQQLWKKSLPGLLNGKIHEVDLYHNNKWQLAFTAGNRFLVLDRNGKVVRPFDMTWKGESLNELAVFDYDQDKDYRFVLTGESRVRMYNRKGQRVKGFTYQEEDANFRDAPVHLRMENRDYLVFRLADGRVRILNRIGRDRVKVPGSYDFASQVYAHRDDFVFTDRKGVHHRIDRKGKRNSTDLGLEPEHDFVATPVRQVIRNGNVLQIGGNEAKLEYGVYTTPQIFYLKNKIYVSITDLQARKTYLFDSSGSLFPGFPVHGNSQADLADMDKDGQPELVVSGTDENLLVYTLQ